MNERGTLIAERYGVTRSAEWPEVVRAHLTRKPACVACRHPGARVEVHHVFPFHFCVRLGRPDLEVDERNLVTLCAESDARGAGNHHLLLGHFDDYESMNLHVRSEASHAFHAMSAVELRASEAWRRAAEHRPLHLAAMSHDDRATLQALMHELMPLRR